MLVVSIVLVFLACAHAAVPSALRATQYRLPSEAVEVHLYNIELRVENATFEETYQYDGTTSIRFTNLKATSQINLHANKLTISQVALKTEDGISLEITNTAFNSDAVTDILTLTTLLPLHGGTNYQLDVTYKAQFRTTEMYGFYKSTYIAEDASERILGSTQFEPTHARKVFPCFDEPSYKAEFNLKIRHPKEYSALSNTQGNAARDPTDDNFYITTFATTPKMSTYLLAFVVSDFTCSGNTPIEGGGTHSVCSRPEAAPDRQTVIEVGPELIKVLQDFTGINYADSRMTKMHQVAIPDFSAGAMENWGLLTYRETGLLWDPQESSNSYLQSIINVVAHEITHMWFGNLITTHWWSDTFLNEGFARYFQYFATAEVKTTWQLDQQFVGAVLQAMLVSDAQPSAQALSSPASSPTEVSNRFGSVSYHKGASIIRMIKHFMGEGNFKTGIQKYLNDHKFGNTKPEDLWSALQLSVGDTLPPSTTLATVVDSWIKKAGFPVLHVKIDGTSVIISQSRFLISGTPGASEKWYVPLTYTLSSNQNPFEDTSVKQWLLPTEDLVLENVLQNNDWIILNNQQVGFYRVHYSDDLLDRIQHALQENENFGGIHPLNRAQLVDDIYNLAKVGTIPYTKAFSFLSYLRQDTSYYPWYSAVNAFSDMLQRTGNQLLRDRLSELILEFMGTLLASVPFDAPDDDDQIYTFNRVQAITWACRLGHAQCVANAVGAFTNYTTQNRKPDKNLKGVVYCNGLRHTTNPQQDFDFLWNAYSSTKLATEKITILSALGCVKDPVVLTSYLQKSIDPTSGIKQQDASSVFSAAYTQNPEGVDIAYNFLIENYHEISDYYGSMNSLSNLFSGLAARFTNQAQIDKLSTFLDTATDLTEDLETSARNALANARANLEWTEEFERQLDEYFNSNDDDDDDNGGGDDDNDDNNDNDDDDDNNNNDENDDNNNEGDDDDDGNNPANPVQIGSSTLMAAIFMLWYQLLR